ncbi:hypothetical protein [Vescimonas sp.]|mgnify:FL=1|uniref:hypothetical protein n=1 Tax=Vescimonas sp. TaxID=2892404 RepID=UPI003079E70B
MEHRDYVYKWLSYTLVSLLFILVQCFGLVHLRVWGVHPFIFPVLVSTVAALETAHESAIYTLALGLLMDLTMPGVLPCFYTVAFLVVFVATQLLSAKVLSWPFFCCMLCGVLSMVCCSGLSTLFLQAKVDFTPLSALMLLGKELLLTAPLMPLVYLPMRKLRRVFDRE